MIQNIKTGTIVRALRSTARLKVTKLHKTGKTLTAQDMVTVAEFDGTAAVRGTARQIKADSLRRRYEIVNA